MTKQSFRIFFGVLLVGLTATGLAGCDAAAKVLEVAANAPPQPTPPQQSPSEPPSGSGILVSHSTPAVGATDIRIGSFNIQAFGQSKLGKPLVMQRLASIVHQFDVLAIQEIRSSDQSLMDNFLQYINRDGYEYRYVLGPRLGRTVSKEQYAYLYDTRRIVADESHAYTVEDEADWLHREPYVARFGVRNADGSTGWTFTLANVHTDPDEVSEELPVLARVFAALRQYEYAAAAEDDVIMVGDFNADANDLRTVAGGQYEPAIVQFATNVAGTKQYDNLLLGIGGCQEYNGRNGVIELTTVFGITRDEAKEISDHLPIWAEFSAAEVRPNAIQ